MEELEDFKPWEVLLALSEKGDVEKLEKFIDTLAPSDFALAIYHLEQDEQKKVLQMLSPEEVARLMLEMSEAQASELLDLLNIKEAASILNEMPSDEQADLLSQLEEKDAHAIINEMEPEEAADVRLLIGYERDVAGGLMITEFLSYPEEAKIQDVVDDMGAKAEEYADYNVQYVYVISSSKKLVGVLRMRDLLLSQRSTPLANIMIKDPLKVNVETSLEELDDIFESHGLLGIPVVDMKDRLVGVVLESDVAEAIADKSDIDHMKIQGIVGGDELRTMPIFLRSKRRLSWLSVNIILNIVSASVIAIYQDTLSSVIALAVFLPIISDMSGCSGNQAVAVSLRELALGIVKPFDVFRVWFQEISVGLINGLALGVLIALVAWLWKGNPYLGLVVGVALTINTLIAVSIGGTIPLILKRFKMDPALASSPILTTITDMFGFFLVLNFASIIMIHLK